MTSAPGRTILIVDTNPDVLQMLQFAFGTMGFVPYSALSLEKAKEVCFERVPDCALIDVGVAGWGHLLAVLRGLNPLIRCCLVGASSSLYSLEELEMLGSLRFFSKPFSLQELQDAFKV